MGRQLPSLKGRLPPQPLPGSNRAGSLTHSMLRYVEHLGVNGYTEQTRCNARRYIPDFIRWCEARSVHRISQLHRRLLHEYQRHLFLYRKRNGQELSATSKRGKLGNVSGWCRWLKKTRALRVNPAEDVVLPAQEFRLPRWVLTSAESAAVMRQPDVSDSESGCRLQLRRA